MTNAPAATPRFTFAHDTFALFVHVHRTINRKITIRAAADQAGVSTAQMFRAEHAVPVNTAAYLALCVWMDLIDPYAFLIDGATGKPWTGAAMEHAMRVEAARAVAATADRISRETTAETKGAS